MMSKARTAVCAARSRSAGIRRIVPKSAGSVTPSAVDSRWTRTLGSLRRRQVGDLDPVGEQSDRLQLESAAWTSGNTSMVT